MDKETFFIDEISELLTRSNFELDELLESILKTTVSRLGLKAGAIRYVDEYSGAFFIRACYGLSPQFLALAPTFDSQSRFARLIQNGGMLQIPDVSQEPDLSFSDAAQAEGIKALLGTGLFEDDRVIGALSVYASEARQFTETEIRTLRVIANHAAIAIRLAKLYQAQLETAMASKELALAAELQAGILPRTLPVHDGIQIAAQTVPWEKVGGDFYDFIELPNQNLGIAIGDVSGKGIPAALLMFAVRMALRAHVEHEYDAREIMRRVNNAVCRDTQPEQFASLFYGVLNVPAKIFTFVNAGHPPPVIFRDSQVMTLEAGGIPVGLLPGYSYSEESISLQPGDMLVLYTDGYTDVGSSEEELFELNHFIECLSSNQHLLPSQLIDSIDRAVSDFVADSDMGDDRTIVVLKIE